MGVLSVKTTKNYQTNSQSWTPIPELSLQIPEGVGELALVILNASGGAQGGDFYPGATFGLSVNGTRLPNNQSPSCPVRSPDNPFMLAATVVASVPLSQNPQTVQALWFANNHCTATLYGPASLSVIV